MMNCSCRIQVWVHLIIWFHINWWCNSCYPWLHICHDFSMHYPSMQHYVGQWYPMQSPVHVSTQVSSNRNFQDFQYPKYAAIMQPPEEQMLQQQQYLPQQNDQQLQPQQNRAQLLDSATLPDWEVRITLLSMMICLIRTNMVKHPGLNLLKDRKNSFKLCLQ